jgi:hypothetical protein
VAHHDLTRALGRRPPRHPVEACFLSGRKLAGSVRDVESDRVRSAAQLVSDVYPPIRQLLSQLIQDRDRVQRNAEPLEVEAHPVSGIHLPPGISAGARTGRGKGRGKGRGTARCASWEEPVSEAAERPTHHRLPGMPVHAAARQADAAYEVAA